MGVEVYSGPIDVRDWDYPTYDVTENIICINPDDSNYVFSIVSVRLSFWINNQKSVRKIKISDVDVENLNTGKLILESGNSKTVATIDWTMLNEKYAKKNWRFFNEHAEVIVEYKINTKVDQIKLELKKPR